MMLFGRSGFVIAVALALAACTTAPAAGDPQEIEWFEGFTFGEQLATPATLYTLEDVKKAIRSPWGYDRELVTYTNDGELAGTPFVLESCADYLEKGQAAWPAHAPDGPVFMGMARMCMAAAEIASAAPASTSHLRALAFDRTLPDRLPWQVAMIISGSERERIAAEHPEASWREAQELYAPMTEFASCGEHCAVYGDEGGEQTVQLVARGDFNHDGVEDVLVSSFNAAKGGTYRALRMFVLTRLHADGGIELVRELTY